MDYHLKPIGRACEATGEELVPGSTCVSVLVQQGTQLLRFDYSEEGWSGPPEGTIGYWQSIVPEPANAKTQPFDADALMRYFEQLCEDANPAQEKFAYVLSLLLLKKRRVKLESSRHEGEVEYLELIGSQGEGPYEVRDQQLSDGEIEHIQHSLNTYLANEWS